MDFLVSWLLFFHRKEPLYLNTAATRQIFPPCFPDERWCHLVVKLGCFNQDAHISVVKMHHCQMYSVETSNFFFYLSKSKSNCSQNYLSKSKSIL